MKRTWSPYPILRQRVRSAPTSTVVLPNCVHRPVHQVGISIPRDPTGRPLPVSHAARDPQVKDTVLLRDCAERTTRRNLVVTVTKLRPMPPRTVAAQNPTTVKCGGGKIGHDGETTRAGHPVRRPASVQFSASRTDSKFEKLHAGVFGPPTGLESNTAEGSATSTDRNRLRRRAPTLTHVRQQAS